MIDFILHINGRGGSGKSTLVQSLNTKLGLEATKNYTTRKPRTPDESGYHFVIEEEFIRLFKEKIIIECNFFNSSKAFYGTSVPTATGIYQSEIMGQIALKKWCFKNSVPYLSIYLDVKSETLFDRLSKRHDSNETPEERLAEDTYYEIFKNTADIVYDYNSKTIEEGTDDVLGFMREKGLILA